MTACCRERALPRNSVESPPQLGIVPRHQEEDRRQNGAVQHAAGMPKSSTMLDHYAQTDMDELIAAQEMMLDAIFSHADGSVN